MPKVHLPLLRAATGVLPTPISSEEVDCSYCMAPCCRFFVELVGDESDFFEWEWSDSGDRKFKHVKRRDDGYCVYYVEGNGCSTYEAKPWVCDTYSCAKDVRVTNFVKYGK